MTGHGFLNDLVLVPQDDGRTLVTERALVWRNGRTVEVPRWFVTDLASIPKALPAVLAVLLSWLLSRWTGSDLAGAALGAFLVSNLGLVPWGKHMFGAVVHDWLYFSHETTRAEADWIFFLAMKDKGVLLTKRWLMWAAVRAFGWHAWHAPRGAGANRLLTEAPAGKARVAPRGLDRLLKRAMGE